MHVLASIHHIVFAKHRCQRACDRGPVHDRLELGDDWVDVPRVSVVELTREQLLGAIVDRFVECRAMFVNWKRDVPALAAVGIRS